MPTYYSTGLEMYSTNRSSRELNKQVFEEGLKRTKEAYTDIGVNLIFISQIPEQMAECIFNLPQSVCPLKPG